VLGRAWADENGKAPLLDDPYGVLRAQGLALPAGKAVRVVEGAPGETLSVPPQRASAQGGSAAGEERVSPLVIF
jgi:hypothetical protein